MRMHVLALYIIRIVYSVCIYVYNAIHACIFVYSNWDIGFQNSVLQRKTLFCSIERYTLYFNTLYFDTLYFDTLYFETLYFETLFWYSSFDTLYSDTLYFDTLYFNTLYFDNLYLILFISIPFILILFSFIWLIVFWVKVLFPLDCATKLNILGYKLSNRVLYTY